VTPPRTLAAVFLLVASATAAGAKESATGTWKWGSREKGGGVLRVVDRGDRADFQLELWRGAPSFNEGSLEGRVVLDDGKGTFRTGSGDHACEIAFAFRGKEAVLATVGTDAGCGFGYGVHADGTYVRTSRNKPVFTPSE
jgi:hypothetical protein